MTATSSATDGPLTANLELSANFLRGEVLYSDPWLLESDFALQARLFGQSERFYKYSVLETGFRPEISRQLTKQLAGLGFLPGQGGEDDRAAASPRRTSGPTSYFISSVGATITFDTRGPDKVNPRSGLIANLATRSSGQRTGQFGGIPAHHGALFLLHSRDLAQHARARRARRAG